MTDSLHPRPLSDIENDVKHIDDTLNTVSELRSTLRGFTTLVQQEKKKRNYVIAFTDHLNQLKRGLNRLGAEGETLKGEEH
ncbi:hypothetical protein BCR43DRAFT_54106 [Syncephalastrum racemosum]|uniref:Uncharacterized protein n=1 Tax=Syncephalastrum racemosum TaxID=13706 RepID=A0A1X2HVD0_SYNRA|nr:hypothetical protein BCR43DRAFT_54106 [Syncephalastrum racemosum]